MYHLQLGIKRPLVGTETYVVVDTYIYELLGIKRPLVGTETPIQNVSMQLSSMLGIKRPLVGTETFLTIYNQNTYNFRN